MVLADLGNKITDALRKMRESSVIDQEVLDTLVKAIVMALIQSDVDIHLVKTLQTNIKKKANLEEMPPGANKRKVIQSVSRSAYCRVQSRVLGCAGVLTYVFTSAFCVLVDCRAAAHRTP